MSPISRETIHYQTEAEWLAARMLDITSTESPALFGMSPYQTAFELWHAKHSGVTAPFTMNDRVRWGQNLEAAIAQGIAAERGWQIAPMKQYMRLPNERIGSSFDFVILNHPSGMPAHLEIKNVDYLQFRDKWISDDEQPEAPEHIEVQVQHQMLVSGFERSYIGVLVGGNESHVIERERHAPAIAAIRAKIAEFWRAVDANVEPDPVMPADAAAVIRLNQYAEPDKIMNVTDDAEIEILIEDYRQAANREARAKEDKEVAKASLFARVGDTEKIIWSGGSVSLSMVADTPGKEVTADMVGTIIGGRAGFRNCRVYVKKGK